MATNQKFGFKYVSRIFVEKELKSLKRKSAAGWDHLPPCMLKDCTRVISGPLTHLINLSLTSGTVPNDWKIAKVTPIHKSGSIDDYNNSRPISVLPVLSKILERAVHTQFIQYIESNNILSKYQFGYRKKRSTELATILLADNIRKEIDSRKLVGAIFVDLSKAFDALSHSVLLEKLKSNGVDESSQNWFRDYFFNRKQFVVVNGCKSRMENVICGVPQGPFWDLCYFSCISTILSTTYIILRYYNLQMIQ